MHDFFHVCSQLIDAHICRFSLLMILKLSVIVLLLFVCVVLFIPWCFAVITNLWKHWILPHVIDFRSDERSQGRWIFIPACDPELYASVACDRCCTLWLSIFINSFSQTWRFTRDLFRRHNNNHKQSVRLAASYTGDVAALLATGTRRVEHTVEDESALKVEPGVSHELVQLLRGRGSRSGARLSVSCDAVTEQTGRSDVVMCREALVNVKAVCPTARPNVVLDSCTHTACGHTEHCYIPAWQQHNTTDLLTLLFE